MEAARVALGVVHLDAVVGQLAQVVVVEIDGRAAARGKRIDGIGEASNAVVANNVPLARDLDAAGILDPLGPGPGRGAFDQIVRDEVIRGRPLGVAGGGEAVIDMANVAVPHDDPRGVVEHGSRESRSGS